MNFPLFAEVLGFISYEFFVFYMNFSSLFAEVLHTTLDLISYEFSPLFTELLHR